MALVLCPGCGETFEERERYIAIDVDGKEVEVRTEHFTDPLGRFFCCENCFIANG